MNCWLPYSKNTQGDCRAADPTGLGWFSYEGESWGISKDSTETLIRGWQGAGTFNPSPEPRQPQVLTLSSVRSHTDTDESLPAPIIENAPRSMATLGLTPDVQGGGSHSGAGGVVGGLGAAMLLGVGGLAMRKKRSARDNLRGTEMRAV